jgi:sigma-B regulation protein RsbU (phosphoserine phosphatase)
MPHLPILLLHGDDDAENLCAEAQAILEHWPGSAPRMKSACAWQVLKEPSLLRGAGVAWLWLADGEDGRVFELIDRLQAQQLPAMLTTPGPGARPGEMVQDGVIACPPSTDPAVTAALLAALHSQASTFAAMRTELKLLRLHEAGVLDRIEKVDEELRLAAQLQREFLPTAMPRIDGLAFHVMWRPAGYVSGDIYDVQRLDEKHVGLFIADAVGHGVPAALMTVYIKRSLSSMQTGAARSREAGPVAPDEALGWLNAEMLRQQSRKVRFATACYGLLNTQTLELQLSRAGHPFPLLLRNDNKFEWIDPEGGLLGVFPNEVYESRRIQLTPGDRLLLYSDGFETAFPQEDAQRLATDRYTQEFRDLAGCPIDQAMQRLADRLDEQAGSLHQVDDLTALMMDVGAM